MTIEPLAYRQLARCEALASAMAMIDDQFLPGRTSALDPSAMLEVALAACTRLESEDITVAEALTSAAFRWGIANECGHPAERTARARRIASDIMEHL